MNSTDCSVHTSNMCVFLFVFHIGSSEIEQMNKNQETTHRTHAHTLAFTARKRADERPNKRTDTQRQSKRHINYVQSLSHTHTPGSKKHTQNSSRSLFTPIEDGTLLTYDEMMNGKMHIFAFVLSSGIHHRYRHRRHANEVDEVIEMGDICSHHFYCFIRPT